MLEIRPVLAHVRKPFGSIDGTTTVYPDNKFAYAQLQLRLVSIGIEELTRRTGVRTLTQLVQYPEGQGSLAPTAFRIAPKAMSVFVASAEKQAYWGLIFGIRTDVNAQALLGCVFPLKYY